MKNELWKYMEIPYVWHGKDWSGADCYGLLILFFKEEYGIELTDFRYDATDWEGIRDSSFIEDNVDTDWIEVSLDEVREGDLILINKSDSAPFHCGVALTSEQFLHTGKSHGAVVSRITTWKKRIFAVYRNRKFA